MNRPIAIQIRLSSKAPFLFAFLWVISSLANAQISAADKKLLFERSEAGDAPAVEAVRKLASDGDVPSQIHLAHMYQYGSKRNKDEAAYWYRSAAERGSAFAQNELGLILCNEWAFLSDHQDSAKWRTKAAEQGRAVFQYDLARDYANGNHCMKQDYSKARYWYKKVSEQGDYRAFEALGVMYRHEEGVAKNLIEEYKWFFLARATVNDEKYYGWLSETIGDTVKEMSAGQIDSAKQSIADWTVAHPSWGWRDATHLGRQQP